MHLQIEMEGKMKPVLTSGIPELAYIDSPEIENKTVECFAKQLKNPAQNRGSKSKTFWSSRWSWESINFIE